MKRRDVVKGLSLFPFAGGVVGGMSPMESVFSTPRGPLEPAANIYQSIGVEPVINCVGTYTIIGGSIEVPEVRTAMDAASGFFVQYDELAYGVGQKLADLTGAEWGVVTSGCAGAENTFTLACLAGGNPDKLVRIPDLTGFEKNEVIIPITSRNASDHAIRVTGVKIINVANIEELGKALNSRTAMIYLHRETNVRAVVELAKPLNIPILFDAAAEDITIPNVHLQDGVTAVCYSGGKALCGPQCAGLLLGKKDILLSAWQAGSPHWGPGRTNKVGKEEMMGMVAAVEAFVKRDNVAKMKTWHSYLDTISKRVSTISGVTCTVQEPTGLGNRSPALSISWDHNKFNITGPEVQEELATKQQRIAVSSRDDNSIGIKAGQMQPGNDKVVAERIYEVLSQKRTKKTMLPPAAVMTGRWDVEVEYFSSKSQHVITIDKQDGNWLQGTHKKDFSSHDLIGVLEGNQIKLSSEDRQIADSVPYLFSGTVSGDKMSGNIAIFGYLNAKFTATRHTNNAPVKSILIPKGEPLAT
jgi:D-glucosaminate-6-phosphate ammonia-lyase